MSETVRLSNFASIANAVFNSVSANSTAVTAMSIGGHTINATPVFAGNTTVGNLTFTGLRITGDFSNSTPANRLAFQSSTTNGATGLYVLPNGSATVTAIQLFANSNPSNTSMGVFATSSTEVQISSTRTGTGDLLPLTFFVGTSERMRILANNGNVGIGITSPVARLQLTGTAATTSPTGGSASGSAFYVNNTDTAYGMQFGIASNGSGWIQQQRSDGTNEQYSLILQPIGGNVGIGTTSPGLGLSVFRDNGNGWAAWIGANTNLGRVGLGTQVGVPAIQGFDSTGIATNLVLNPNGGNARIGAGSNLGNSRLDVDTGITARTAAASGVTPYLQLFNGNAGTDLKTWRVGATSAGGFAIETVNDAYTAATQRMLIDASGRLRVPFQPAFYIQHVGASGINQQNVTVVLDFPLINRGSAYNTSNGRYTCPVAGLYQFFFGTIKSDAGVTPGPNVSRFRIRRNGSNVSTELRLSENGGYGESASLVCLVECAANDFIDVFISDTGGWYGGTYAHFGGFLLG